MIAIIENLKIIKIFDDMTEKNSVKIKYIGNKPYFEYGTTGDGVFIAGQQQFYCFKPHNKILPSTHVGYIFPAEWFEVI